MRWLLLLCSVQSGRIQPEGSVAANVIPCLPAQPAPVVAAAFCLYYLATNYVLGSILLAGILEQWNVKDSESRRLQRRTIIRELHSAQVTPVTSADPKNL